MSFIPDVRVNSRSVPTEPSTFQVSDERKACPGRPPPLKRIVLLQHEEQQQVLIDDGDVGEPEGESSRQQAANRYKLGRAHGKGERCMERADVYDAAQRANVCSIAC